MHPYQRIATTKH
ncbi:MAG: hypothetical protein GC180_00710 [Bacteroidetes bacterium]|nr:hypothetical protein [Bacteroidota bacterium]